MTDSVGTLYVVSTPIGNMGDFSFRAVEVLRDVTVILAEDTRHSRPLLARHEIATPVTAYHEHNEASATPGFVRRLEAGESLALISDAGTPLLSDPGARLVQAAIDAGIPVVPIPGASALLAALVASGLDASEFTYFGFLPRKGVDRRTKLDEIASSPRTAVLYEAANRTATTLAELTERAGADRRAVVARELTKKFEAVNRGTLESLRAYYEEHPPRGEVVILVSGALPPVLDESALLERARSLHARGMSAREITAALVEMGASRNVAYRLATESGKRKAESGRGTADSGKRHAESERIRGDSLQDD